MNKYMTFDRRDLLKSAVFVGAGLAFPRVAFGDISKFDPNPKALENFFVLVRISPEGGGLDVTLGLDPWVKPQRPLETDIFLEYKDEDITRAGNLNLGPAAKPLALYANDLLVLNGVFISNSDNGHSAALFYQTTGNGQGHSADLPVELEVARGSSPYGILVGSNRSLNTGVRRVAYVRGSDVLSARKDGDPTAALERAVKDARTPLERAIRDVVGSKETTLKLRQELSDFEKAGATLKDAHVIAAGFLSGAAAHAQLDLQTQTNLDTHSNHEKEHLKGQLDAWTQLADVFSIFKSLPYGTKGESLFDRTTFMVVSDFSRTPALNASKGKDHNPLLTSILFAGYGLQKNKTINESLLIEAARSKTGASYHMASPFDYATGLPARSRQGASFIYPENVIASVGRAMGVDPSKLGSVPANTPVIPGFAL